MRRTRIMHATSAAALVVAMVAALAVPASAQQDDGSAAAAIRAAISQVHQLVDAPVGYADELSLTASPTTGLVDGQTISVTVAGPAGSYQLTQCAAAAGGACQHVSHVWLEAPGDQTGPIEVDRLIYEADLIDLIFFGATATRVDCADTDCVLRATGVNGQAEVPLTFDPDAPLRPAPVMTIESNLLYSGQEITIAGSGFRPFDTAAVGLCHGPNPSGLETFDVTVAAHKCALLNLAYTDENGSFSIDAVVESTDTTYFGGEVFDCIEVEACWISASTPEFRGGFTTDLEFISEELANADPNVLERLTGITVSQRLDQVHMAETKQGE